MSTPIDRRSGPSRPSICFVALKSYNLLAGRDDLEHIGGAELQQTLVARELVRRGHAVSFVTLDHGQPDGIEHDGIRIFKAYSPEAGFPVVRFLHPRWSGLSAAMRRADADIYYQRAGGLETGQVAMWCRRRARKFVFAVAVDSDCLNELPEIKDLRSRKLYRFGLNHADRLVVQTESQRQMMRENFGLQGTVIRSCGVNCQEMDAQRGRPAGPPRLLWMGRFCAQKGLERLLDLAALCPQYEYDLVGNCDLQTSYARSIRERAARMANVHLEGSVAHAHVGGYYFRSSFLVCTSHFEGFPNTFLEAWARGVPVATTLDPDGIIAENALGCVSADLEELARRLDQTIASPDAWNRMSSNARVYFSQHHTIDRACAAYEALFCELAGCEPVPTEMCARGATPRASGFSDAGCGLPRQG